jgi:hypothetical protein
LCSRCKCGWAAQVENDRSLLDECLEAQGHHAIVIARNTIEREERKGKSGRAAKAARKERVVKSVAKVVTKMRTRILALKAENGKLIRDLTGFELVELETKNASRATLYRELSKKVKGKQIVGDVLDDEKFSLVVDRIGDIRKLVRVFDRV